MGLPFPSAPSFDTFMVPNMFLKVTVVNFVVPGVIFDFASFSFQVPICGSAAKHIAQPKKQSARVNPMVLVFIHAIESGFLLGVNAFSVNPPTRSLPDGPAMVVPDPRQDE